MNNGLLNTTVGALLLCTIIFSSCSNGDEVDISGTSELSLSFNIVEKGVELDNQTIVINKFVEARSYNVWAEWQKSVWLDVRFNFTGKGKDNQEYSGYIQFASLETDLNKVELSNESWRYVDPTDMQAFLDQDLVIILNESGFNDSNDDRSTKRVELTNDIFQIERTFSGHAWQPYMDGIQGFKITDARFITYLRQ